jgi:hypothetical protein
LPEAVGAGGILLDPQQPIADWADAIRKLWQDRRRYDELSSAAAAHAQRPEMALDYQMDAWECAMLAAARASGSDRQSLANAGPESMPRRSQV